MDETWISPKGKSARVLVPRELKQAPTIREPERIMHITMIFCVSADGQKIPPTAILPGVKYLPADLADLTDWFHLSSSTTG